MVVQCPNPTQKISERGLGTRLLSTVNFTRLHAQKWIVQLWCGGPDRTLSAGLKLHAKKTKLIAKMLCTLGHYYEHTAVEGGVTILNACVLH